MSDANGNASWNSNTASQSTGGNVGFGSWGDCAVSGNVSEFNPVTDSSCKLTASQGKSVSINGNYAVVGAPGDNNIGSAAVYRFDGTNWVFMQKLQNPGGLNQDRFGSAVCISGNLILVGANGENGNAGAVHAYRLSGSNWVFVQKISNNNTAAQFGTSISIANGIAVIGAPMEQIGSDTEKGSASSYLFDGTNWLFLQKLTDPSGAAGDRFGTSVALTDNFIVVGSPQIDDLPAYPNTGGLIIFKPTGFLSWSLAQRIINRVYNGYMGISVSLAGNYLMVGQDNQGSGYVDIYKFDGFSWQFQQSINDNQANAQFGISVSMSTDYALIGQTTTFSNTPSSVHIYQRIGNTWLLRQKLTYPTYASNLSFGYSVSLDPTSKRFIAGMYRLHQGMSIFGKIN